MTDLGPDGKAPRNPRVSEESARLMARHGDLMDSRALTALFKFGSDRSFRRSATKGNLPVSVFRVAGRRGWFARTRDVAEWLGTVGQPPEAPLLSEECSAEPVAPSPTSSQLPTRNQLSLSQPAKEDV